jgi:hypothetical protein
MRLHRLANGGVEGRGQSVKDWARSIMQRAYRAAAEGQQTAPPASDQISQRLLFAEYTRRINAVEPLPSLVDAGFRVYSQIDEDGILLYVLSIIGMGDRLCAEVALGSPLSANTTNLICNWGWDGLLIESDHALAATAESFFRAHPDTWMCPPKVVQAWVTAENINELFAGNGLEGTIDLLSIDLDGVDYWIWKALEVVEPRVVIVEVNNIWGPKRAMTVPYDPAFVADGDYVGASLGAFMKLGQEKGYRLVGAARYGFNAFFVKNGEGDKLLPEVPAASCFMHRKAQQAMERLPTIEGRRWIEV